MSLWGWVTGSDAAAPADGSGSKQDDASVTRIEGLDTINSDMDAQMLAAKVLGDVTTYAEQEPTAANGWSEVETGTSTDGLQLWERAIPKLPAPLTLLKIVAKIQNATPADILGFTLETDLEKRKVYDPDLMLLEVLQQVTPSIQLTRTQLSAPYPVYPREFVDLRTWIEGDDKIIFGSVSINMPNAPHSDTHVRGNSMNGIVLESIPGEKAIRIVFMGFVNPQGWVPHAIIAMFRTKIIERIDAFRKMVAEKRESEKK